MKTLDSAFDIIEFKASWSLVGAIASIGFNMNRESHPVAEYSSVSFSYRDLRPVARQVRFAESFASYRFGFLRHSARSAVQSFKVMEVLFRRKWSELK